jgi:superfamily II DNA or RNA helicase
MADLLGVSFASVNRWENGQARPSRMAWDLLNRAEQRLSHEVNPPDASAEKGGSSPFVADPERVRLVAEAERLAFGHLFNPAFATETALIDPLPHQRIAVYERMLGQPRLRFLLADDAGAGKTIMAGLYAREMLSRRLIRRILIVPPAGLLGNWERELRTLFSLQFRIIRGTDTRSANPFVGPDGDLAICSIDTLSGSRVFARLQDAAVAPYDLVVFDEAHKLAADQDADLTVRKTDRYLLAEALAGVPGTEPRWALSWSTQHLILLTATPHMGKDRPYYFLWRLLEPEVLSTIEAFHAYPREARRRQFIRRTKEELVRLDGTPIYPRRESSTHSYNLGQGPVSEQALYDETTGYMETFYNRARILNRSAARLAMSVFQRRLASSSYALMRSFERRVTRLEELLEKLKTGMLSDEQMTIAQRRLDERVVDPFDVTADEDDAGGGGEHHELAEEELLAVVVSHSLAELEAEREQVQRLLGLARAVITAGHESKFDKLRELLLDARFRDEKLIVFTEHRDTLQWLTRRLEAMGLTDRIASIHGGMDYREREAQVEFFRRPVDQGGARYLVATDAAGEGVNLQFCWLMVNYDIPWNPARLEQRMGRIHRYGQKRDPVVILNLVAGGTREGRVLKVLLDKLESIRKELGSDKVFDVVGQLFENVRMTDFMAAAITPHGAEEAERSIAGMLTADQVRALEERERVLYGEGGDVRPSLARLRSQMDVEALRRLLPGYIRRFVEGSTEALDLAIDGDPNGLFALRPRVAGALDALLPALETYPPWTHARLTVYRPPDRDEAIFLHPGESVFERLRTLVLERFGPDARRGAVFVDPTATRPYMFHLAEITVVRRIDPSKSQPDLDDVVECRLVGVRHDEADGHGDPPLVECPVEHLLLLRGAEVFPVSVARFAASAPEWIARVGEHLTTNIAAALGAERRRRLREDLPEREAFVVRGYDAQDAELAAARVRLAEKAAAGSTTAKKHLDRVKEAQRTLAARRRAAVADVAIEPERIAVGTVRMIAHALVVPSADPEDRRRHDTEVETVAMRIARAYEEAEGAAVRDVCTPAAARACGLGDHPGFDLLSIRPDGSRRAIEVKGRASVGDVEVTDNEWAKACNLRHDYWLHVVYDCATPSPRLFRVCDPFGSLLARAKGGVIIDERQIVNAAEAKGSHGG